MGVRGRTRLPWWEATGRGEAKNTLKTLASSTLPLILLTNIKCRLQISSADWELAAPFQKQIFYSCHPRYRLQEEQLSTLYKYSHGLQLVVQGWAHQSPWWEPPIGGEAICNKMKRVKYGEVSLPVSFPLFPAPLDTLAWCDTATLVDHLFIVFFLSDRDSIKR